MRKLLGRSPQANTKSYKSNKETVKSLRIATWNLGSLTGRSAELAEVLKRRRIHIACIQETKWKGSKARNIGNGYKAYYFGIDPKRNGVAIVADSMIQERVVSVERCSDRIMMIKVALENSPPTNILCAYAPNQAATTKLKKNFGKNWTNSYRQFHLPKRSWSAEI